MARSQVSSEADSDRVLPTKRILQVWWPLAASWALMALEGPAISAIVARLTNPEVHLAAYGGIVFPLALFIEAPIIMLLAASTALSVNRDSYRRLQRFMYILGAGLTLLHLVTVLTPLYDIIAVKVIGAPKEIIEPARLGMMIMLPWTWAIAYRRFNQGALIRFGHSLAVGMGTLIRLGADGMVLLIGYQIASLPGIVVATAATSAGVLSEALYVGLRIRPVLRDEINPAPSLKQPLTFGKLLHFYIPLSLTPLIFLTARPIVSAGISRMPQALASLAAWPVVTGVTFLWRSFGVSYNEVVVALVDEPGAALKLRRFSTILVGLTTVLLIVMAATPLSLFWFRELTGLSPALTALARRSLWFAVPLPALSVLQSWYQGVILHGRRTRSITEAVGIFLLVCVAILWTGVRTHWFAGIYVGLVALSVGEFLRTAWLAWRSREIRKALAERDAVFNAVKD